MRLRSNTIVAPARLGACVLAMLALAAPALAAQPPRATAGDYGSISTLLLAVLFGLLIIGVNLLPAKRGHQD